MVVFRIFRQRPDRLPTDAVQRASDAPQKSSREGSRPGGTGLDCTDASGVAMQMSIETVIINIIFNGDGTDPIISVVLRARASLRSELQAHHPHHLE